MWRGQSAAGVVPLPRSWPRQAQRTGSGAFSRAQRSSTIIKCSPVSTSGWYSGRCGTPHSRATSGSKRGSAPHSRSTSNRRLGCACISPRDSSCHTRSGTRASTSPSATICISSAIVSGATVKSGKRAARRARRNRRTGSSTKAGDTCRKTRACRSRWPPCGSINVPSSAWAMALMVRSRRDRSSSSVTPGAACTVKPW